MPTRRTITAAILLLSLVLRVQADDLLTDGGDSLAHIPHQSAEDIARSSFGSSTHDGPTSGGEYPTARFEIRQSYYGAGIFTASGDGRVVDCISRHSDVGARLGSSDSEIRGCRLYNNRDACLWIAKDAGNCQSTQNHCYGARIACYNGGEMFRAVNDTYADSPIGLWSDGGHSAFTNILFQHNPVRDAILRGGSQSLMNCIVNVQREVKEWPKLSIPGMQEYSGKVGVELEAGNSIRGGAITLTDWRWVSADGTKRHTFTGNAAEACRVMGNDVVIDTLIVDSDGIDGSKAVHVTKSVRNLNVDITAVGFEQPNDRVLVIDARCNALDVTIRIDVKKPIGLYIDVAPGWTGSIKIIDTATGNVTTLAKGKAA